MARLRSARSIAIGENSASPQPKKGSHSSSRFST
jgi:hypothetical protein